MLKSISINLFNSPAYSRGIFFTTEEKKPLTIIDIALSSVIPRLRRHPSGGDEEEHIVGQGKGADVLARDGGKRVWEDV